jgi:2-keto-3-deoxy-L-rhamnonate aldolase RhmA
MTADDPFILTLWTADAALAAAADAAGIDRIGVDLEHLGKRERQKTRATWISPHAEEDLDVVRPALTRARLFARVNPINPDSVREIEEVIARGAQVLMLPMAADARQASEFVRIVDGRAAAVLLVEHVDAMRRLREIAAVPGVDEIHIGLNDLAISLGLRNRWLALAGDLVTEASVIVREAGLRFGVGGIGRAGDANMPIPSDLVYAQYARTGARAALISRSFFDGRIANLTAEVARSRAALASWCRRSPRELADAHAELNRCAARAEVW